MRYEIIAKIKTYDTRSVEYVCGAMRGFGRHSQHKTESGYLVFFSTRYLDYIKKFKEKTHKRFPNATFIERQRE